MKYIVALDQGTTSSRAVVFDEAGGVVALHAIEFPQYYPQPGWVEHDPSEIFKTQVDAMRTAVAIAGVNAGDIMAIGITDQRETTILWERATGEPLARAIVWQCRRTSQLVEKLKAQGLETLIRARTGLVPDAYFSGTKIAWLLDEIPGARARAARGEICFGTVDSFLAYKLTGGRVHVTDATNAARTMLYDIEKLRWDEQLLAALDIPEVMMPRVVDSSCVVGMLDKSYLGREIPIASLAGDQHAALYGQACFSSGMVKNTYGTGCFILMNTGARPVVSKHNLLTTIAWQLDGKPCYALEGSVFMAGATIKWLRDEMRMIDTAAQTQQMAWSIPDNEGVYLVPAFTGLGAPHWDMYARGALLGMTRGTGRAHVARAALEAIAYQSADVLEAMALDSGISPSILRADGGASANDFLMQFQADISGVPVVRPATPETTALGAAMLAARAVGMWSDADMGNIWRQSAMFSPAMAESRRAQNLRGWRLALSRARNWLD